MRLYPIIVLFFVLCMCSSNTEVYRSTFKREYQNGKSIEVIREDEVTKWKGLITGADYGGTSSFTYQFTIEPDDFEWKGNINQAPLALVFCNDQTYMKATERLLKFDSLYGPGTVKDTTLYFKNIDERYFFKLFGKQYFADIDSVTYHQNKANCSEVLIPNL